jgi:hypothetical protein
MRELVRGKNMYSNKASRWLAHVAGLSPRTATVKLLHVAVAAWAISCGSADDVPPDTTTASEALTEAFSLPITLPRGVSIQEVVVGASESVELRDQTKVFGTTAAANASVTIGNDARVADVTAKGNIRVGDRSKVQGNLKAGGTLTVASSASVTGTRQSRVNLGSPVTTTLPFRSEATSAGPINLGTNQSLDLSPGTYSGLNLGSGATLVLHTGTYFIRGSVTLEAQSTLSVESSHGPVQLYLEGALTFRGAIKSATVGVPQILVGKIGTGSVTIERSFTGLLIAPSATVALQAALPAGHRALVYGKTVRLEPGTVVNSYPFSWGSIDPALAPPIPADVPVIALPRSPLDMPIAATPGDNGGNAGTAGSSGSSGSGVGGGSSGSSGTGGTAGSSGTGTGGGATGTISTTARPEGPITFTLPQSYPVSGGTIGSGCVDFEFKTTASQTVTCRYCGGSSTATPTSPAELNKGRTLHFQSCSDGLPRETPRTGTEFELSTDPIPGYPFTVNAPVTRDGACSENLELLSAAQTTQMRESFRWSGTRPATNADGTPALYYAWILIRTKEDALNLRRLFIHVLSRPLFSQELDQFEGRCGAITNPGDGTGTFVPVLIPGVTYNRLIQALTSPDVEGDRTIFEAIIIRDDVPVAARNTNGSVRLDVLGQSGFQYLHYEPRPFAAFKDIQQDAGDVARALVSAVTFVAEVARTAGNLVTQALSAIDGLIRGRVDVKLHLHALTEDKAFPGRRKKMERAWGPSRGQPLAAPGLEVSLLQKFLDLPVPTTSISHTDDAGTVRMSAVDGGNPRGSGLCIRLKNDAALITDFLMPTELCDFRGIQLRFDRPQERVLNISDLRLIGFYQAYDAYKWSEDVVGFSAPRARILSGFWAQTFTRKNDQGESKLYTSCLSFGTFLDDTALEVSIAAGQLSLFFPPPMPVSALVLAEMFAAVMLTTDIVMPVSNVPQFWNSRLVMSHEYGHYLFCAMMDEVDSRAVGQVVEHAVLSGDGDNQSSPVRYFNEAFADVVAGQVAGGANYGWLSTSLTASRFFKEGMREDYCVPNLPPADPTASCFDDNQRGVTLSDDEEGDESVGRIVTLLHDMIDGHHQPLTSLVPNDAALWQTFSFQNSVLEPEDDYLTLSTLSYGSKDDHLERVALPGAALRQYARAAANRMLSGYENFDDVDIYGSVNHVMRDHGRSWCDRCRVLALHSPTMQPDHIFTPRVRDLFEHCIADSETAAALGERAPDPYARLDARTCTICPTGQVANEDGVCETCPNVIHGNTCQYCGPDVYLDGTTMSIATEYVFDPGLPQHDDCPEGFSVAVLNPAALFARGGVLRVELREVPQTPTSCAQPVDLTIGSDITGQTIFGTDEVLPGAGTWTCIGGPVSSCSCTQLPSRAFTAGEVSNNLARMFTVQSGSSRKLVVSAVPITDPR